MGKSFFTGTEAELLTGSHAFSDQISAAPTPLGLTTEMCANYAALHATYAEAYQRAKAPDTRTKGTVAGKKTARQNLKSEASRLTSIIQGQANVSGEQKSDLGLSVRATPTPVGDPGTPYAFKVMLDGGTLVLKWKCANPRAARGTIYQIWREVNGAPPTYLGGSGLKKFIDATVPAGSAAVTYKIQAMRSKAVGMWAVFVVSFGIGGTTATRSEPTKIAA